MKVKDVLVQAIAGRKDVCIYMDFKNEGHYTLMLMDKPSRLVGSLGMNILLAECSVIKGNGDTIIRIKSGDIDE